MSFSEALEQAEIKRKYKVENSLQGKIEPNSNKLKLQLVNYLNAHLKDQNTDGETQKKAQTPTDSSLLHE